MSSDILGIGKYTPLYFESVLHVEKQHHHKHFQKKHIKIHILLESLLAVLFRRIVVGYP